MKYDVQVYFDSAQVHPLGNMEEEDFIKLIASHNKRAFWLTDTALLDLGHATAITWFNEERHF